MPFATKTGELTCSFLCTGDAQPMLITCGFKSASFPGLTALTTCRSALVTAFGPILSSKYSIANAGLRYQDTSTAQLYVETAVTASVCSGGASAVPSNCALIIRKKSTLTGKKHRGRMYVPGPDEGDVDQNGLFGGTGTLALVQGYVNTMFTAWETALTELVIHHSTLTTVDGKERWVIDPTQTPTTIDSFQVAPRIGTQRRRMSGRTFTVG